MKIKIDNREEELIKNLNYLIENIPSFKDIQVTIETLPLGDIIIYDDDSEKLVIERKTVNDLLSSIKDGRYEEQSYRLNGLNHHNHNIIYLIEGDINRLNNRFKDNKIEKLTLYSAILSLNYYKGFSVIRTFSLEETAIFICNTVNKIKKGEIEKKNPYYGNAKIEEQTKEDKNDCSLNMVNNNVLNNVVEDSDKDYVSVVKKVKKENITPDNIGEIMLCQIPGISSVTSLAIINKFKTFANLITCIHNDSNCLNDITSTNSKGQQRKISKTCISNIYKFLLKK
uniref:ERCC4 domain-containing protein n=1 Tax=viral metagenome TaxID=1070528 RepID=A0A6C0IEY5_9ZZZZ